MQISRRNFLGITGASLLSAGLLPDSVAQSLAEPMVGRVLRPVPVIAQGEVVRHLWPDSTVPLAGANADVFRVPGGTVDRKAVQPMIAYTPENALPVTTLPALVSVVAPVVPVRSWAAIDAPLVARVGYGGVLLAVDELHDAAGTWYAVSEASAPDEILGWTPANRWSAVASGEHVAGQDARLVLNRDQFSVALQHNRQTLARFPAAVGPDVAVGQWAITDKTAGGRVADQHGAGWMMRWPGGALYGVHWHHDQGGPGREPGWGVAPWAARWLYQRVAPGTPVVIR